MTPDQTIELIVTTNFDGFHQRSASHCRAHREPRVADMISLYGQAGMSHSPRTTGGMGSTGAPLYGPEEFALAVGGAFQKLAVDHLVQIIVVGYAFGDAPLTSMVEARLNSGCAVWWIDPAARLPDRIQGWHKKANFKHLRTRAEDFFYDVGEKYFARLREAADDAARRGRRQG